MNAHNYCILLVLFECKCFIGNKLFVLLLIGLLMLSNENTLIIYHCGLNATKINKIFTYKIKCFFLKNKFVNNCLPKRTKWNCPLLDHSSLRGAKSPH